MVPHELAGQYAKCADCGGRLWVPTDAPRDEFRVEAVTAVTGNVPAPPLAGQHASGQASRPAGAATPAPAAARRGRPQPPPPPPGAPGAAVRGNPASEAPPQAPPVASPGAAAVPAPPVAVPAPPQPSRKTARFITPEAADSTLKLAEDGKLPDLALREGQRKDKPRTDSTAVNPLVLFIVLTASVVMSVFLVMMDFTPVDQRLARQQARARATIEEQFLAPAGEEQPERYQVLLREALLEHSRGNFAEERRLYRRVLRLLRAELPDEQQGVTGSRYRDAELEELLTVLVRTQ